MDTGNPIELEARMSEKITRIFVKSFAEIEFRYTDDAHSGTYTVKGERKDEVIAVLKKAEREKVWVDYALPLTIYNPTSVSWISGVLIEHYGLGHLSYENTPEREHFSDHESMESPSHDEWGSRIFY